MLLTFLPLLAPAALVPQDTPAHPAHTAFFARIPDVQALIETYPKSAVARLLSDPELHEAVGAIMKEPGPVAPLDLLMQQYAGLIDSGEFPPVLDIAAGLSSVGVSFAFPNGDIQAFIAEMEAANEARFAALSEGEEAQEIDYDGFEMRVVLDFVDAEACAAGALAMEKLFERGAPWRHELRRGELTLAGDGGVFGTSTLDTWYYEQVEDEDSSFSMSGPTRPSMFVGGSRLAIVLGGAERDAYAAQLAGISSATSWAHDARLAALGGDDGTTIVEMSFNSPIKAMLAEEQPFLLPLLDIAEGLLGPAASIAIHGGDWRISFDEASGQFVTRGVHGNESVGPLSGLLGAQPIDAEALTLAHPDAMAATVTSLDASVLQRLLVEIEKEEDPTMFDQIEQAYGFRPDTDLAGNLGDAVAYSLAEIKSLVAAPNLMLSVELEDPAGFKKGMDGLYQLLVDQGGELEVARRDYKKISTLYEFSIAGLLGDVPEIPGVPLDLRTFIRPTIAILDGRAVFTMTAGYAKKEVRRVRSMKKAAATAEANGTAPDVEIHPGMASMGAVAGASTLTHAEWAKLVAGIYDTAKALVPMIAGGADLPIDVGALPSSELIVRHFKPTRRMVRIEDGRVRHEVRSSFGPEATLVPVLAAGAGTMAVIPQRMAAERVVEARMIEVAEEPVIEDFVVTDSEAGIAEARSSATRASLTDLEVALTLYQLDRGGAYPATLDGLKETSDSYKDGYVAGGVVPMDGWDRAFVYVRTDSGYSLRSMGPNGVDDGGEGDDIVGQ